MLDSWTSSPSLEDSGSDDVSSSGEFTPNSSEAGSRPQSPSRSPLPSPVGPSSHSVPQLSAQRFSQAYEQYLQDYYQKKCTAASRAPGGVEQLHQQRQQQEYIYQRHPYRPPQIYSFSAPHQGSTYFIAMAGWGQVDPFGQRFAEPLSRPTSQPRRSSSSQQPAEPTGTSTWLAQSPGQSSSRSSVQSSVLSSMEASEQPRLVSPVLPSPHVVSKISLLGVSAGSTTSNIKDGKNHSECYKDSTGNVDGSMTGNTKISSRNSNSTAKVDEKDSCEINFSKIVGITAAAGAGATKNAGIINAKPKTVSIEVSTSTATTIEKPVTVSAVVPPPRPSKLDDLPKPGICIIILVLGVGCWPFRLIPLNRDIQFVYDVMYFILSLEFQGYCWFLKRRRIKRMATENGQNGGNGDNDEDKNKNSDEAEMKLHSPRQLMKAKDLKKAIEVLLKEIKKEQQGKKEKAKKEMKEMEKKKTGTIWQAGRVWTDYRFVCCLASVSVLDLGLFALLMSCLPL